MKKIISLLLMVAMLFTVSAFAEKEFTLRSGLVFGMEKEDAIAIEEKNGVILQLAPNKANSYSGIGTIAGQAESELTLRFDENDKLEYVRYDFATLSSYDILNKSLIEKYGVPIFTSETGGTLIDPALREDRKNSEIVFDICIIKTTDSQYAEWLIPYSETQDIVIYHDCWYRERIPTSAKSTYHNWMEHSIVYRLLSEEETKEICMPEEPATQGMKLMV